MERRKKRAAARRRQRLTQQLLAPEAYEVVKLNNRRATAIYDEDKRRRRQLMSKTEVLADKQSKAEMRRNQRLKKNIAFFMLKEGITELAVTLVPAQSDAVC